MPKRDQGEALRQVEQITEVVRVVRNPLVVGGSDALGELLPATNEIRYWRCWRQAADNAALNTPKAAEDAARGGFRRAYGFVQVPSEYSQQFTPP